MTATVFGLFHVAIKTADLEATRAFYIGTLGLLEVPRPDFGYPGGWLACQHQAATRSSMSMRVGPALGADGRVPAGSGAIDHVSLSCSGYHVFRQRFADSGVAWRESLVPGTTLCSCSCTTRAACCSNSRSKAQPKAARRRTSRRAKATSRAEASAEWRRAVAPVHQALQPASATAGIGLMGRRGSSGPVRLRHTAEATGEPMPRPILDETRIHPAIRERVANHEGAIVQEVQSAIARHAVVVVGMRQNPFPRRARRALDAAGITYAYLEYGSYLSEWRRRTALKMWSGWPTFPMVFVKGQLVGGAKDLAALIAGGELKAMLA